MSHAMITPSLYFKAMTEVPVTYGYCVRCVAPPPAAAWLPPAGWDPAGTLGPPPPIVLEKPSMTLSAEVFEMGDGGVRRSVRGLTALGIEGAEKRTKGAAMAAAWC